MVVVGGRLTGFTACVGSAPLLASTFASPLYSAVTVCSPPRAPT